MPRICATVLVVVIAVYFPFSSAITCFNLTSVDGTFTTVSKVQNCLACMRYTTIYDSAATKYTLYQWACSLQPAPGMAAPGTTGPPKCIESTTLVTYADGSLYSKACTCCSDNCNTESFCEPEPKNQSKVECAAALRNWALIADTSPHLVMLLPAVPVVLAYFY